MRGRRACHGGRPHVRTALYMCAVSSMRCNPVIRAFAARLTARGRPYKSVATACAHKLLTILNAMVKAGAAWAPPAAAGPA